MEVKYTAHLQWRLNIRSIPYELPRQIWEASNEHYMDTLTNHNIAIHKIKYNGKLREMAVSYDKKENSIEIITVHPIKSRQKNGRIHSGRWIKI